MIVTTMPMERNAFIHLLLVVQSFYHHWCYSLKWNPSSTCTDRKWNPSSTFRLPLVPLLKQALPTPLLWLQQPLPLPPPLPLILLPPLMLSLHLLLALPILPLQPHYEHDAMMDIVILQVKTETFTLSLPILLPSHFLRFDIDFNVEPFVHLCAFEWNPSSTFSLIVVEPFVHMNRLLNEPFESGCEVMYIAWVSSSNKSTGETTSKHFV